MRAIPITSAVLTYENVTPSTMTAPAMNAGIVRRIPVRSATSVSSRNAAYANDSSIVPKLRRRSPIDRTWIVYE
jgi:hypothetical protein